jgi:dethiobiotin synthetase
VRRLVLLGTGTGVGKTHLGSLLVRAWGERGQAAWGLKPIESGVSERADEVTDAERLWPAAQRPPGWPSHQRALRDPVSPHLAARREGVELSVDATVGWVMEAEAKLVALHDNATQAMSLVETAGGAFTPLSATATCADLARALGPAFVVLVAPDALGVLHDVSATLLALHAVGCSVDAVVLSESRPDDASTGTNSGELEENVFPRLRAAAPSLSRVFRVSRTSPDLNPLLDAWATFP